MSETPAPYGDTWTDLHAQLACRLFGWTWDAAARLWRDPDGVYRDDATFRRRLPAYSTDPVATALVWQWLETRGLPLGQIAFAYAEALDVQCVVHLGRLQGEGWGATWPDALCRAALALAAADEPPDAGEGEG